MISKTSRYSKCEIFDFNGKKFFGRRIPINTNLRDDDRFHTVKEGERLDLLAYTYFGKAELWWIIADYNSIDFPLAMPEAGTVLRLPSLEQVEMGILD